MKHIFLIFLLF